MPVSLDWQYSKIDFALQSNPISKGLMLLGDAIFFQLLCSSLKHGVIIWKRLMHSTSAFTKNFENLFFRSNMNDKLIDFLAVKRQSLPTAL